MAGEVARAGLLRRIRKSQHTIDIVYPPKRVPATGTVGGALPIAPLTGPMPTRSLVPAEVTPSKPAVTGIQCLWYDQTVRGSGTPSGETRSMGIVGWREGASAVVCVAVTDVAADSENPYGATVFDGCDAIVHFGRRYHLLARESSAGGGALPHAFTLWLASAEGQ